MNIEKQTQNTLVIHFISSVEIAANTFGAIEISTLLLLQYYPYCSSVNSRICSIAVHLGSKEYSLLLLFVYYAAAICHFGPNMARQVPRFGPILPQCFCRKAQ